MMHQEISLPTIRNGQNPTYSPWAASGSLPPSSYDKVVVTGCHGWNPHSEGASCDCHHRPFSSEEAKVARKEKARNGTAALA
jgi:hypothetical protein